MANIKEVFRAIPSQWAWRMMRVEGVALTVCGAMVAWGAVSENLTVGDQIRSLRSGLKTVEGLNIRLPEEVKAESDLVQQITQDQLRRVYWLDILNQQGQETGLNGFLLIMIASLGVPFVVDPRNICRNLQDQLH